MLSEKMAERLNEHLNNEIYSAYFYMGMASYATSIGLNGFASWFSVQVQEELFHVQKFYDYINQQGVRVLLQSIKEPPQDFSSALDLFDKTLEHEQKVTSMVNDLVSAARTDKDNGTEIFLQWFVSEQIEEEASVNDIIQKLKLVGSDGNGLFMIDNELGQRTFTEPAA